MRRRNRDNNKIMNALSGAASGGSDSAPWKIGRLRGRFYTEQLQQALSLLEADDIDGAKKIVVSMLNTINLYDGEPDFKLCLSGAVSAAETTDIATMQRHLTEATAWLSTIRALWYDEP